MRFYKPAVSAALLCAAAQAADIEVSGKADLAAKIASAKPGDKLLLADGAYDNVEIKIGVSGTEAQPIVLQARNPGKAVMHGSTRVIVEGKHVVVSGLLFTGASTRSGGVGGAIVEFTESSEGCRLTQISVEGYNTGGGSKDNWVNIWGFRNRVDHCSFTGKNREGEMVRVRRDANKSDQHRIDHNYFGKRPSVGGNGGEIIQIGLAPTQFTESNSTVDHNLFEECDGEIELLSSKSSGNAILFNTVVRCASRLTLRHGYGCRMEGNFIFGGGKSGTGGIRVYGPDHVITNNFIINTNGDGDFGGGINLHSGDAGDPKNNPTGAVAASKCLVAFNKLVDNRIGIVFGSGKSVGPSEITLANNLIRTASGTLVDAVAKLNFSKVEGNLFSGGGSEMPAQAGVSAADPLLQTSTLNGYPFAKPGAGSPALGHAAGDYRSAMAPLKAWVSTDFPDVGENLYGALRPLARADVGPAWNGGPLEGAVIDPIAVLKPLPAIAPRESGARSVDALGRLRDPDARARRAARMFPLPSRQ